MKLMRTHYLDASAIVEKQIGVRSTGPVAQMMLATIIHSSYKHGNTNQVWRYCHDGSTDRKSAEDLLSSYEP